MSVVVALDIGGTKVGWGLVETDLAVRVLERGSIPTLADQGGEAVAQRICELAASLIADHPEAAGIAVASAGVVDPESGRIVSATNTMPGWGGTPLGDMLRDATGVQVSVINDVHAHGLGEATYGAGANYREVLSFAIGTGIGGALITDGEIFFGERGIAGHVGHIHHHYAPDMVCSCGRQGHIESFCSGSGITAWYESRRTPGDPKAANGRELQDLADGGHPLARACFTESAYALGEAIASLANCVDPSVIVLSGSMTRSGDIWWDALRRGYAASAMTPLSGLPLILGDLGGDAPLLGATSFFLRGQR